MMQYLNKWCWTVSFPPSFLSVSLPVFLFPQWCQNSHMVAELLPPSRFFSPKTSLVPMWCLLCPVTVTQGISPTVYLRLAEIPVCSGSSGVGLGWSWLYGQDDSWWMRLYCILLRDQVCRLDRLLRASWSSEDRSEHLSLQDWEI